jgi:protoheme IX farnesyltransferase
MLVGLLPYLLNISGIISCVVVAITASFYLMKGIQLAADLSDKSARKLMFASFIYLPVVFMALLLDKI